ncbi:hypothetical protein [Chitinophaga qingshengii]|uniref:Uncharacterized protein n=1 Tax=Chitinophaga qingshengii TaxID=1569794 RepID=A0ABR7TSU3_9BACT|nr:hypothetical protein [Chitinophaga qingshengii]MBC9933078.1 hypothetical protein [Chitinophaga qingshengii]
MDVNSGLRAFLRFCLRASCASAIIMTISMMVFAQTTDYDLARTLSGLSVSQKKLLYQYGTLQTYAGQPVADSFWQQHTKELQGIDPAAAGILAKELLANTDLEYTVKKPSRLQALRGVFTASRLLIGLAALIAAYSLIHLLSRFWSRIYAWLYRKLYRVVHLLFSPRMLTWELLLLSVAGIYFGVGINELLLRTVVLQVSVFTLWAQLTAVATRQDRIKYYYEQVVDHLERRGTTKEAMIAVGLPALGATLALVWLMFHAPENWYAYEVVVPGMVALFTLPPVIYLHAVLKRIVLPFPVQSRRADKLLAVYTAATLLLWIVLVLLPPVQPAVLVAVSIVLTFMLLPMSIEEVTRCETRNYIWLQLVTVSWLCACVLAGGQRAIPMLNWTGLGGLLLYVIFKYWEVPVLLGYSWRNRKALGSLGMAILIWAVAMLARWQPQWFIWF